MTDLLQDLFGGAVGGSIVAIVAWRLQARSERRLSFDHVRWQTYGKLLGAASVIAEEYRWPPFLSEPKDAWLTLENLRGEVQFTSDGRVRDAADGLVRSLRRMRSEALVLVDLGEAEHAQPILNQAVEIWEPMQPKYESFREAEQRFVLAAREELGH